MTDINLFNSLDYKAYLRQKIALLPKKGRGFKAQLAERIGCQKAFVSQVLQGTAHFNLEHADKINATLQHDREEAFYFLLLVQHARAGTESLRQQFAAQMDLLRQKRQSLKSRLQNDRELSAESKSKYYSSWVYGAIRVATTIPGYRTKAALQKKLALSEERLNEALAFLETNGLLEKQGEQYHPTAAHLHLGNDQDMIVRHHTNWRLRTLDAIANPHRDDLHYSAVVSLSRADAAHLKTMIADFLEKTQTVIKPSREEALFTLCADFFEV